MTTPLKAKKSGAPTHEKTIVTEAKLKALQGTLFEHFKVCNNKGTEKCATGECDVIVTKIHAILLPYGESIFKRSFKRRATLEEMYRVIPESINALILDVWDREKFIHTSWGSLLKYKMLHYLDGKINLFDVRTKNYSVESVDSLISSFSPSSQRDDVSGSDVIDYMSRNFIPASINEKGVMKENIIGMIMAIVESFVIKHGKYIGKEERAGITIKVYAGVSRFLRGHNNYSLFKGDPRSRYYYIKVIDEIYQYLDIYKRLN